MDLRILVLRLNKSPVIFKKVSECLNQSTWITNCKYRHIFSPIFLACSIAGSQQDAWYYFLRAFSLFNFISDNLFVINKLIFLCIKQRNVQKVFFNVHVTGKICGRKNICSRTIVKNEFLNNLKSCAVGKSPRATSYLLYF